MTDATDDANLIESYTRAGFLQRLDMGLRPALLIVDFVKAYLLEDSPLYGGEGVRAALRGAIALLAAARAAAIPIVHTNVAYDKDGRNGGVFFRKLPALRCFAAGTEHPERCEFAPGLAPAPGEIVITKQYASAFFGTTLASTLTSIGVETLLIAGVTTSGCVRATGVDCCQHGFVPVIVRDAVGDRALGPHAANLFDLQAKYAEVRWLSEVAAYLLQLSANPRRQGADRSTR
jgi:maleamate amidohydrolase